LAGLTVVWFPLVALLFALLGARQSSTARRLVFVALVQLLGASMVGMVRAVSGGQAVLPWVATSFICCGLFAGVVVLERLSKVAAPPGIGPDGPSPAG
jgi:hypothetical protein